MILWFHVRSVKGVKPECQHGRKSQLDHKLHRLSDCLCRFASDHWKPHVIKEYMLHCSIRLLDVLDLISNGADCLVLKCGGQKSALRPRGQLEWKQLVPLLALFRRQKCRYETADIPFAMIIICFVQCLVPRARRVTALLVVLVAWQRRQYSET